jgi:uncharacterized protein (DUF849 family)
MLRLDLELRVVCNTQAYQLVAENLMNRYALHEHYQKAMDAIADRFHKMTSLAALICFSFTWAVLSHDATLMTHALDMGFVVLCGLFLVLAIIRPSAARKVRLVRDQYAQDHMETFGEAPRLALTGLFP